MTTYVKFLFTIISLVLLNSLALSITHASSGCTPNYGGGKDCPVMDTLVIDKKVQHPQTKAYVDNLTITDARYTPDSPVSFQITITNTGNKILETVKIQDIFPGHVNYISGPGTYDASNRTLTFDINSLNPQETRIYFIAGKTATNSSLPQNQGITCVTNIGKVITGTFTGTDEAQLCIEKQIFEEKAPTTPTTRKGGETTPGTTKGGLKVFSAPKSEQTPATGPEALILFTLVSTGITGFMLCRKTRMG